MAAGLSINSLNSGLYNKMQKAYYSHSVQNSKTILKMHYPLKDGFVDFLIKELGTECTAVDHIGDDYDPKTVEITIDGIFVSEYIRKLIYRYYPLNLDEVKNLFFVQTHSNDTLAMYNLNPRPRGPDSHLVVTVDGVDYRAEIVLVPECVSPHPTIVDKCVSPVAEAAANTE